MNRGPLDARAAWIFVGLVAALEVVSTSAFLAAVNFSLATLNDPARLVAIGDQGGNLLRVAALLDMLGYLSAVPLAMYLRDRFRGETAIDLFTLVGIIALVLGATGAAIFAYAGAPLIREYISVSETGRPAIAVAFSVVYRVVFIGLWQTVDAILAGLWLVGTGRLAWKHGAAVLASVLIALGALGVGVAVAHILGAFPTP